MKFSKLKFIQKWINFLHNPKLPRMVHIPANGQINVVTQNHLRKTKFMAHYKIDIINAITLKKMYKINNTERRLKESKKCE